MKFKPLSRYQEQSKKTRDHWLQHEQQRMVERRCFYLAFESKGDLLDWQIELLLGMSEYSHPDHKARIEARIRKGLCGV